VVGSIVPVGGVLALATFLHGDVDRLEA
jgi:hypothetical protein